MKNWNNLFIYLISAVLISFVRSQQVVSLVNTTRLAGYTTNTKFEHLSFDTPLQEKGKLVDYDDTNTYVLGRKSFLELSTYYFLTVKHSDLTSSNLTLSISGYQLSGMGQHQGTLDYFIGLHIETEEVRVGDFDMNLSPPATLYCKTVPITTPLVTEYMYADCKYIETRNGKNVYVIGIGASSFDLSHPGQYNYVYAKFNTLYNFTETIIESDDPEVSERLVDIKVDTVHEQIYIALDINTNTYKGASIYQAGDEQRLNNPNIAIIAYSFKNAVIKWIKIIGDLDNIDYYADMEINGNSLIVALNSYTMNFSSLVPSKDILVYEFRYETGVIKNKLVLGSSSDDIIYDLSVHTQGIYLLAIFGPNFYPHPTSGAVWGSPTNSTSLGLIWISHSLTVIDIESYATSTFTTLPLRIFPSYHPTYLTQFTFLSPASLTQKHGCLLTHFVSPSSLFSTQSCNLTCPTCSRYPINNETHCISCDSASGLFLYNGHCYSEGPIFSFVNTAEYQCKACDYTCKKGVGQRLDQCTDGCKGQEGGTSLLDRVAVDGRCEGLSASYDSLGKGLERGVNGMAARMDKMGVESGPRDTYAEVIWDDPVQENEYTHYDDSDDTDGVGYDHVLKFSATGKGIAVPGPTLLKAMPKEFTLSFWMRAESFNTETYLINLFERVFVRVVGMKVLFGFERSSGNIIEPSYIGAPNQISYDKWVYISISQKEHKTAGTNYITQKLVVANGRTTEAVEAASKTDHSTATYSKFTNKIFIGGYSYTVSKSFKGYIKEVRLFNKFHDSPQMINDRLRAYELYSFGEPYLIAYWKLSENYTETDTVQEIKDYSISNVDNALRVEFNPITNADYPTFVYNISLGLNLCFYHDVAICKTVSGLPQVFSKSWRISNPSNFPLASYTYTIEPKDEILFKRGTGATGTTMAKMKRSASGVWTPDSLLPPADLLDGMHYSTCYITSIKGYELDLGQIYISKTSTTVDPSDVSIMIVVGLSVRVNIKGGDEAYGDILRFSEDCDSPKSTDHFLTRTDSYSQFTLLTTRDFTLSRRYKMGLIQPFMQTLSPYSDNINGHSLFATSIPTLSTANPTTFYINDGPIEFIFDTNCKLLIFDRHSVFNFILLLFNFYMIGQSTKSAGFSGLSATLEEDK